jgi:cobalt-zinc-cadmium efflux system protein
MEHSHNHSVNNSGNAFKTGIIINIVFIIIEIIYGLASNSMALIADAGHNFSDVLALVFSWIAIILSQRKPTLKFTYGLRRSTILIALLNTILLLAAVGIIAWETFARLSHPVRINSSSLIIVASVGIIVNGFTALLFMKGKKHDLNIRSAFLHFVADALVSLGVVAGGIVIAFTGYTRIDSLVSFIIVVVILYSTYRLLIDSVSLALDAVPENVDAKAVREYLLKLPEVTGIHDLHIWALSTTDAALTVHLATRQQTDVVFIKSIQKRLNEDFGIGHATIQVEYGSDAGDCETDCNK